MVERKQLPGHVALGTGPRARQLWVTSWQSSRSGQSTVGLAALTSPSPPFGGSRP